MSTPEAPATGQPAPDRPTARPAGNGPPVTGLPRPIASFAGYTVLVAGFGVTGYACADQLMQRGARVIAVDGSENERTRRGREVLSVLGGDIRLGPEHVAALPDAPVDLVVVSPGWRPDQPLLAAARRAGIPVWGEVELAWRMRGPDAAPWLCVTGTNGKTTVVTMLETILRAAGLRAVACGNVGTPLIEAVLDPEGFDVLAVELSSYQLHWSEHVDAEAACVLNITPDHLDWHGSADAYAADKGRIYEGVRTACIYNTADAATLRLVEDADVVEGARAIGITLGAPGPSELGVVDGLLVDRAFLAERRTHAAQLGSLEDLAHLVPGGAVPPHAVFNALAAAALARAHGVPPETVRDGLRAFRPGAHRIETVHADAGVTFVDDSKATNPEAARAALSAYQNVVWIAGGLAKGAPMDDLVAAAAPRLRAAVLIGTDEEPFRSALGRHAPSIPVHRVDPGDTGEGGRRPAHEIMDEAVSAAAALAQPGDAVLLAPACASMDQFTDYAQRGTLFAEAARRTTIGG